MGEILGIKKPGMKLIKPGELLGQEGLTTIQCSDRFV
jgi:hypothetical protein